jgi:hypothetical protein
MLHVHRKEQWDLDCWPIVCVHNRTHNRSKRVFCLWLWGVQIGNCALTRKGVRVGKRHYRF